MEVGGVNGPRGEQFSRIERRAVRCDRFGLDYVYPKAFHAALLRSPPRRQYSDSRRHQFRDGRYIVDIATPAPRPRFPSRFSAGFGLRYCPGASMTQMSGPVPHA